jgi:predicted dehydrogenase
MIGCGAIARQYLDTARRLGAIEIVAAADRVPARATAVEAAEGIPAMPVADLSLAVADRWGRKAR